MKIKFLSSSSSGNSMTIEDDSTRIMIDCGISFKKVKEYYGAEELDLDALFITHEHADHVNGAGVIGRKTDAEIYIPELSFEKKASIFNNCNINFIQGGDTVEIGNFIIKAYSTKHDSLASVGYTVTDKSTNKKFGYLSDTGMITKIIRTELKNCDAYFIEADYDTQMLIDYEDYDDYLKQRIQSPIGHLSNEKALSYIKQYLNLDKTQWIALGHLSPRTNSPETLKNHIEYYLPEKYWDKIYIIKDPLEMKIT